MKVFWLEPTEQTRDERKPCECGCGEMLGGERKLYRRSDTGELVTLAEAPAGAMWDLSWYAGTPYHRPGPDGIHLAVRTPGGTWDVESRASNCTMPNDDVHRCWVRHGDPRRPETVHVDKSGVTCGAGAGSILRGGYHGFLHNGELTSC